MRGGLSPTRAVATLVGAIAAAALIWAAATQLVPGEGELSAGDYWGIIGLLAAAGLMVALSQLLGGWTKAGATVFAPVVFLLGFLPVLVVAGFIIWANQPEGGWLVDDTRGFADDLGATDLLNDLSSFLALYPFAVGLFLGFCLDTAPREERVVARREFAERVETDDVDETSPHPLARGRDAEPEPERPVDTSEAPTHPLTPTRDDERGRPSG